MSATIMSVQELLSQNLRIPGYQRPYRWTTKNISDLLADINITSMISSNIATLVMTMISKLVIHYLSGN